MMKLRSSFAVGTFAAVTLASSGLAQDAPSPPSPAPSGPSQAELMRRGVRPADFRPNCCEILQLPASSFLPRDSSVQYDYDSEGYIRPTNLGDVFGTFWATVTLPAGASIRFLDLYYYDTNPLEAVSATLTRYYGWNNDNSSSEDIVSAVSPPLGGSGRGYASSEFISHTVENNVRYDDGGQYSVVIYFSDSNSLGFKGVDIWWHRQVSPAPGSATFGDVPTDHPYFRFIEALADSGITAGCGGGNYCPSSFVTRGEMAVFLAKALGLQWQAVLLRP